MKKIELACIIDDDPIFVFATKKIMAMADFCENYLVYRNGKEALDKLTDMIQTGAKIPEIIFLDLNMPVMDGWQFLEEFAKIPASKNIKIYIVSSSIDPADINKAKSYEKVGNYLVKPITVDVLKGILNEFAN